MTKLKNVKTIYTVPLHVGENVEVPNYAKVTYYDPKIRFPKDKSPSK